MNCPCISVLPSARARIVFGPGTIHPIRRPSAHPFHAWATGEPERSRTTARKTVRETHTLSRAHTFSKILVWPRFGRTHHTRAPRAICMDRSLQGDTRVWTPHPHSTYMRVLHSLRDAYIHFPSTQSSRSGIDARKKGGRERERRERGRAGQRKTWESCNLVREGEKTVIDPTHIVHLSHGRSSSAQQRRPGKDEQRPENREGELKTRSSTRAPLAKCRKKDAHMATHF